MPVLKTRLYKPVVKPYYVIRKNILNYLDKHADNTLSLVIAAAGYGKSVTVSQWLDHKGSKYGWISLDEECNDLRVFLDYLVTCIQISYPDSMRIIQDLSNSLDLPPVKMISDLLVNEIIEFDEEFVLVLDDYHLINNLQIHSLISEILKYPCPKLKLFLLSRKDPPLMLSTFKAYDKVNEIRMSELRFNELELIELSEKISSQPLEDEIASNLIKATEGWIIALKLVLESIRQGRDIKAILSDISSEKQTIAKFMIDEILHPQSKFMRDCLLKTSILSRFCEGLLNALCANEEIQGDNPAKPDSDFFSEISTRTLFIIPLDADYKWFRHHHLLSEILHKQLKKNYSPDQISAFHRKAGRWFESNGYPDEALDHSLKAGDIEFANQIIENQFNILFDNEKLPLMDKWLKMMPVEARENYLAPNLILAFLFDTRRDHVSMEKALNRAYEILKPLLVVNPLDMKKLGYYLALQSIMFYQTGRTQESLSSSTQALELLETENSYLKDAALAYNAFGLIAKGKRNEADKKVTRYGALIKSDDHLGLARNGIVVAIISFLSGDLPRIYNTLNPIIDFYKERSLMLTRGMANYYLGIVNYQWNYLDEAIHQVEDTWELRFSCRPSWVLHNLFIKALVLFAKKERSELNNLFDQAHQYAREVEMPGLSQLVSSMQVEIALLDNDLSKAVQYHHKARYDFVVPLFFYFIPQLTMIKFMLIEGGQENFGKAFAELNELIDFGRKSDNINLLIQASALMAALLKRMGKIQEALTSLSEALKMAKPGGFIRFFADMGKEIRDLILLHKKNNPYDPYMIRLLEVIDGEHSEQIYEPDQEKIMVKYPSVLGEETLSSKEIEMLKLVAIGFQNKEIADKLFLSPNSVKKYLYKIYQKLDVKNRTNAINKAKRSNLI